MFLRLVQLVLQQANLERRLLIFRLLLLFCFLLFLSSIHVDILVLALGKPAIGRAEEPELDAESS